MKLLNHPKIVKLYDSFKSESEMFLVLEFVSGGEVLFFFFFFFFNVIFKLFSYCEKHGPLPENEARVFFRDILGGVDYMHHKGFVHNDVKLENCLLDENKRVKLIDFGLSVSYLTCQTYPPCGTNIYAAPEVRDGSGGHIGTHVDVWALGVLLFAMCSSEFPFQDVQEVLEGSFEWPENVSFSKILKDLLGSIFVVDIAARATLDQVRRSEWVNGTVLSPRELQQQQQHKWRADLIWKLEAIYGFPIEEVMHSLLSDQINVFTATYKILLRKHPAPVQYDVTSSNLMASIFAEPVMLQQVTENMLEVIERFKRGDVLATDEIRSRFQFRKKSSGA